MMLNGRIRWIRTIRPIDEWDDRTMTDSPFDLAAERMKRELANAQRVKEDAQALEESFARHPANRHKRCADCNHTVKVHTEKAHDGHGGCAYCKCQRIAPEASQSRQEGS